MAFCNNEQSYQLELIYSLFKKNACCILRLGEADKAIHHFKQSPKESTGADVSRAQSVKTRIAKCNDARKLRNWITVLQESQAAVSDGADCAPQVSARLNLRQRYLHVWL